MQRKDYLVQHNTQYHTSYYRIVSRMVAFWSITHRHQSLNHFVKHTVPSSATWKYSSGTFIQLVTRKFHEQTLLRAPHWIHSIQCQRKILLSYVLLFSVRTVCFGLCFFLLIHAWTINCSLTEKFNDSFYWLFRGLVGRIKSKNRDIRKKCHLKVKSNQGFLKP